MEQANGERAVQIALLCLCTWMLTNRNPNINALLYLLVEQANGGRAMQPVAISTVGRPILLR